MMKTACVLATVVSLCSPYAAHIHGQPDPSGQWRTWHTEHFRVHAKASLASQALRATREAERAYAALATELRPPRGRVDLVLSDDIDFSNGLATVFPSNRITVYLGSPSSARATGVYDDWLRFVITHELAHVFHFDRADGVWNGLQKVFGRAPGLFPNTYQPGWVVEGVATYYESRFTNGGRLRGALHGQLLAATARDGTWPRPGDTMGSSPKWPGGQMLYAWGSRFFEDQARQFGDSLIPRFIERTSRQLMVFNVSSPNRAAGGDGVAPGWRRLEESYAANNIEHDLIDRGLRAVPRFRASPDGHKIAYSRSVGKSDPQLVVRELGAGEIVAARRSNAVGGVAWVGDTIFVTQFDFASPVEIRSDLYRWDPSGDWERLSRGERHTDVFTAGDGHVGVVSLVPGGRTVQTSRLADTTRVHFPTPPATDWGRIAISPDGRLVAGARHAEGRWDIVVWPNGIPEEYQLITNDAAMDTDPMWELDGQSLLFSSERTGLPQLYSHELASGRTSRLTDEPTGAWEPARLPDGTLLFTTVLGDGYAIARHRQTDAGLTVSSIPDDPMPLERAQEVDVRETSYSPWPSLRPHYWIPIAHDQGGAGFFVGALTTGRDAIGRTAYSALVTVAPETRRMEAVVYLAQRRWRSWTADLAGELTWDYGFVRVGEDLAPLLFREQAVDLGVSYRWRRWRSSLSFRVKGFLERDVASNAGAQPLPFTLLNPTFLGSTVHLAASHASRPPYSISPENGASVQIKATRRWQLAGDNWSNEIRGRIAGFLALPLPGYSNWVLAGNIAAGWTGGPTPTRYSVGGESSDVLRFVPGTELGSGRRSFAMRGYSAGGSFTRAAVGVLELRIPVLLVARGVGRFPLFLDRISLNLFGEIGGGWNVGEDFNVSAFRDVGGEVAVDLGVGVGIPFRVRLGGAVALADGLGSRNGDSRFYLAFGQAF